MSTTIAIVGASGAVGTALAQHLLKGRILRAGDRILLVGHGSASTERKLLALRTDLLDAFDDDRISVDVVDDVDSFVADIVVVAAGATLSADHTTRRDLALTNLPIFKRIAERVVARLPQALFIVVSNSVELAVEILSRATDRHRVVGMGAQQDSLRFARAIANDLGLTRHDVRASVFGEHGHAMVPLWETVELVTRNVRDREALARLIRKASEPSLEARVSALSHEVDGHLAKGHIRHAYRATRRSLPDARILVEPRVTVQSMHSTPNATANATMQLIAAALVADGRKVHGQVRLAKDALGIDGVFGFPIVIDRNGWEVGDVGYLSGIGREAIMQSARSIQTFNDAVLASEVRSGMVSSAPTSPLTSQGARRRRASTIGSPVYGHALFAEASQQTR